MSAALRRSPNRALQTARMASRSASSSRFAACAACAATNSPRPATTAATSRPPPAIARPTWTSAPRSPPASSAAPSAATSAATTSGQRQLARLTSTWAAVSSNPFGSSRSTGTERSSGMRRATVGATRRIPSKSVPSPSGRPKLNVVSPRTSARWRDASARCTTRRNTGVSATARTSGTRSGRTTSALGTALLVSPVTIWSATTRAHVGVVERGRDPRRELLVVDERGVRVPRDRRPGEQQRGQDDHDEGGRPAHARTLSGSAPRSDPPSMLPFRERADLATWVPRGRCTGRRRGPRRRGLRVPARRQPRRGDPGRRSGPRDRRRAGDERRGRVPRQRARRSRRRLPRRSPSARATRSPRRRSTRSRASRCASPTRVPSSCPRARRDAASTRDPHLPGGPLAPGPDSPRIYGWQHIPSAQATLSELFGAAGYRTAMVTDNTWMLKPSWPPFTRRWGDFVGIHGQVQQSLPKGGRSTASTSRATCPTACAACPARRRRPTREVIARYVVNRGHRRPRGGLVRRRASSARRRAGSSATRASHAAVLPLRRLLRPPRAVGPAEQVRRALRRPRPAA